MSGISYCSLLLMIFWPNIERRVLQRVESEQWAVGLQGNVKLLLHTLPDKNVSLEVSQIFFLKPNSAAAATAKRGSKRECRRLERCAFYCASEGISTVQREYLKLRQLKFLYLHLFFCIKLKKHFGKVFRHRLMLTSGKTVNSC